MNRILKNCSRLKITISTIAISFFLIPNIASARDHAMVCRVGGDMRLILTPNVSAYTHFELHFKKAANSYNSGRRNMSPGECTWFDRRISSSEPTLMAINLDARVYTSSRINGSGGYSNVVSDGGSDTAFATNLLKTIKGYNIVSGRLILHDYFIANVQNTNRGFFEIHSMQTF